MVLINKNEFQLPLGSEAPNFTLPATDGKTYSLDDFKDKVLVVVFSCNHCPYVKAYEQRLIDLQNEFAGKGVQIIAINSNDAENYPEDNFEAMKENALEKNFNFLYLRDEDQDIAKAYGAECTPHVFVFDAKHKLVYQGGIDDKWDAPDKVENPYLRNALTEVVEGKGVSNPTPHVIGCSIKWLR